MFAEADLPVPDAVRQALTDVKIPDATAKVPTISMRPVEAHADWISVDVRTASATGIMLALLRKEGGSLSTEELADQVMELRPDLTRNWLLRVFGRLASGVVERNSRGWTLIAASSAAVLLERRLWGPPRVFTNVEVAEYRGAAIVRLLTQNTDGLRMSEIARHLLGQGWVAFPLTREALTADMDALAMAGKAVQREDTKVWYPPGEKQRVGDCAA